MLHRVLHARHRPLELLHDVECWIATIVRVAVDVVVVRRVAEQIEGLRVAFSRQPVLLQSELVLTRANSHTNPVHTSQTIFVLLQLEDLLSQQGGLVLRTVWAAVCREH